MKLKTLNDFLNDNKVKADAILVQKIIKANDAYRSYLYKGLCAICDKKITVADEILFTPMDYLIVCKKHRKYANYFQPSMIRMQLLIKPRQ